MKIIKSYNSRYLSQPMWVRIPISIFVISCILVSLQNPLLFPGALFSLFHSTSRDILSLPSGVESIIIETKDHHYLEAWRLPSLKKSPVAIVFHGNGGDVENFFVFQKYLENAGISSYGFDYRGYGVSTGWPSEQGLENDADAITEYVLRRENVDIHDIIFLGISIGSGPASYAASKFRPGALVLFAPFISLKEAVRTVPVVGILNPRNDAVLSNGQVIELKPYNK